MSADPNAAQLREGVSHLRLNGMPFATMLLESSWNTGSIWVRGHPHRAAGRHLCERLNRTVKFGTTPDIGRDRGVRLGTRLGLMVGATMSIFISIAAYRDPELMPTIRDCILRARYPNDLRFGICWQHSDDETTPSLEDHRLRVIDVPWHDSRGACWARAEIMKLWDGEDFFLQLELASPVRARLGRTSACPGRAQRGGQADFSAPTARRSTLRRLSPRRASRCRWISTASATTAFLSFARA